MLCMDLHVHPMRTACGARASLNRLEHATHSHTPNTHLQYARPKSVAAHLHLLCWLTRLLCAARASWLAVKELNTMSRPCPQILCKPCFDKMPLVGGNKECPLCRTVVASALPL